MAKTKKEAPEELESISDFDTKYLRKLFSPHNPMIDSISNLTQSFKSFLSGFFISHSTQPIPYRIRSVRHLLKAYFTGGELNSIRQKTLVKYL